MRGLIYKDLYMAWKYCKSYILMIAIFAAALAVIPGVGILAAYPCIFSGTIAVNLLSYDERDQWLEFSTALPISRAKIVSVKYIVTLLIQMVILAVMAVSQGVRVYRDSTCSMDDFWSVMKMMMGLCLLLPALELPFMFDLGIEKGRIASFVILVVLGGLVVAVAASIGEDLIHGIWPLVVPAAIYAVSWLLSIRYYQKRDL